MKSKYFGNKYLVLARDMFEAQRWAAGKNLVREQWRYVINKLSLDGIDAASGWKSVRLEGFIHNPRSLEIITAVNQMVALGDIQGIRDE